MRYRHKIFSLKLLTNSDINMQDEILPILEVESKKEFLGKN